MRRQSRYGVMNLSPSLSDRNYVGRIELADFAPEYVRGWLLDPKEVIRPECEWPAGPLPSLHRQSRPGIEARRWQVYGYDFDAPVVA